MTQSERRLASVGELTLERFRELAEIAEAEAETRHGRLMLELIDHIDAQADELIRLRRKLVDASDALTWMGNKVTNAFHVLGSEDNPQEALDILYAAYRRYHDELKGRVTNDPPTVLAMLDRIEALEYMVLRLYQDTVVPDTGYCHRCGCRGFHDETCAMAEVEELLGLAFEEDDNEWDDE